MIAISPIENRQIQIARIICIFFMMGVHVSPGPSAVSVISTGGLWWIGAIWIDVLGRASVAVLSFVSGYLLIKTSNRKSIFMLARQKFVTLIVPLLVWNFLFLILLAVRHEIVGSREVPTDLASLTGLTGPTANLSLWFLRDLFVSLLLVRLILPRLGSLALVMLVIIAITDCAEPLVFRPAILLFVAMGAMVGRRSTLSGWLTLERAGIVGIALGLFFLMAQSFPTAHELSTEGLVRRGLLVLAVLGATRWLASKRVGDMLVPAAGRIFETYLVHASLFGVLWTGWQSVIGDALAPSYAAFFLLAPFAALVVGDLLGEFFDRLPKAAQITLRGKPVAFAPIRASI